MFDPGVHQDLFATAVPEDVHAPMHAQGAVVWEGMELFLPKVLFDSGALHASYLDDGWLEEKISEFPALASCISTVNMSVVLGDNKTRVKITRIASLEVSFVDSNLQEHRARLSFCVMAMPGLTMIIGLPHIVIHFLPYFILLLDAAKLEFETSLKALDLHYPWSTSQEEEAPEETDSYVPCSFTGPMYYLSKPFDDIVQEYLSSLSEHVCEDMQKACPEVMQLLKSDLAMRVFLPREWLGISGVPDLELEWRDTLPQSLRPKPRPINPRLYEPSKSEFMRMRSYMYVDSDSEVASPLVVAPKATTPFIRMCGDYVVVNRHLVIAHHYIPHVQYSLHKASGFSVFIDLDWTNAYHQIRLGSITSNRLSIQTPWGLVRPVFLPEGVGPASGILQRIVMNIFSDFDEWTIAIFDNLLVLAHDYADACRKLEIILNRAAERNVVLKMAKSWIGFSHATFFGYLISKGKYELSAARKDAIAAIQMPRSVKQMQSFLGAALFFKSFIPRFSDWCARLNDMTHTSFNWDKSTWKHDYEAEFEQFKKVLQRSCEIFFPNYELDWIMRTDASDIAAAMVLFQVCVAEDGTVTNQPIMLASKKFSEQARNWDIHKKEAYGNYFGVLSASYMLRAKPFVLETDHANLIFLEKSTAPIIIRWRVYMQSFNFLVRYLPGNRNKVADFMTRMFHLFSFDHISSHVAQIDHHFSTAMLLHGIAKDADLSTPTDVPVKVDQPLPTALIPTKSESRPPEWFLSQVHGGRSLHPGARRTWIALNNKFPGHKIPYQFVSEFVASCPTCQKDRLQMTNNLQPIYRHLRPPHHRSRIGIDRVTITPADNYGNTNAIVIVAHFSKHVMVYPASDYNAQSAATSLFSYFCHFGLFDELISDPGSDFLSDTVKMLNQWFGVKHVVSLVDRHQSNGVEGSNKQLLRHLRMLVHDERLVHEWSAPYVLPLIVFALNDALNSETGLRPFDAVFGSDDGKYFHLPKDVTERADVASNAFVMRLTEHLRVIREVSAKYQAEIVAERGAVSNAKPQNIFQPGDFVLFQRSLPLPSKLSSPFEGPFEVIVQRKNDVECRHLVLGSIRTFHVERLKLFVGDRKTAYAAALLDNNQFVIKHFLAYRGDPLIRTTMEFEIEFDDGSVHWVPWSPDLFAAVPYEEYCRSRTELFPLIFSVAQAQREIQYIKTTAITAVAPGDRVFVDLRSYGAQWYATLPLPDRDHVTYVLEYRYTKWIGKSQRVLAAFCEVFNEMWPRLDAYFVFAYGSVKSFDPQRMVLVDSQLLQQFPELTPST